MTRKRHTYYGALLLLPVLVGSLTPTANAGTAAEANDGDSSGYDGGGIDQRAEAVAAVGNVLQQIFQQKAARKAAKAAEEAAEAERIDEEKSAADDKYAGRLQKARADFLQSRDIWLAHEARLERAREELERIAAATGGVPARTGAITILDYTNRQPDGSPTISMIPDGPIPAEITFGKAAEAPAEVAPQWKDSLDNLPAQVTPANAALVDSIPSPSTLNTEPNLPSTSSMDSSPPEPGERVEPTVLPVAQTESPVSTPASLPQGENDVEEVGTPIFPEEEKRSFDTLEEGFAALEKANAPRLSIAGKMANGISELSVMKRLKSAYNESIGSKWQEFKQNLNRVDRELFPWATLEEEAGR